MYVTVVTYKLAKETYTIFTVTSSFVTKTHYLVIKHCDLVYKKTQS